MKPKTTICPKCAGTGIINTDTTLGPKLRMERLKLRVRACHVGARIGLDKAIICRLEAGHTPHLITADLCQRWREAIAELSIR